MSDKDPVVSVQYRNWHIGQPPRRTKLDIGGWAGENSWKKPQAWHCKPYSDASTYGLELIYPWETTCVVSCDAEGKCTFEGDFTKEKPPTVEKKWEPFGAFAPFHFGYVSMVDIKTPEGHGLMVQPHPRVFSDRTGSVPVAVPGLLEMDWWPEIFFVVFKAPMPGCQYIFKQGDPVATFMVVPKNIKYDIQPQSEEVATDRSKKQFTLEQNWHRMCTRVLYCEDDEFFDNKYKVLSNIARREGNDAANRYMDDPELLPHFGKNPSVMDSRPEDKQVIKHKPWDEEGVEAPKDYAPILPDDFWKDVPPIEDDEEFVKEGGLGDLEDLIAKTNDFDKISDADLQNIITTFKRQKRKQRQERSAKLRANCDPKVAVNVPTKVQEPKEQEQPKCPFSGMMGKKQKGEWVQGHEIEKLL